MKLTVSRYNPETDSEPWYQEFELPVLEKATVLQGLMYIYEHLDSTLSFSFNCRYKNCGLCTMTVDGQPRLTCITPLQDGSVVEPLRNLPVLKDLMIDRKKLFTDVGAQAAYIPEPVFPYRSEMVKEPPERQAFMSCNECLACVSVCPYYLYDNPAFAGPMFFVKLTQLHLDPRDRTDRRAQARELGIENCLTCAGCPCLSGIPIRKGAVALLLGEQL